MKYNFNKKLTRKPCALSPRIHNSICRTGGHKPEKLPLSSTLLPKRINKNYDTPLAFISYLFVNNTNYSDIFNAYHLKYSAKLNTNSHGILQNGR